MPIARAEPSAPASAPLGPRRLVDLFPPTPETDSAPAIQLLIPAATVPQASGAAARRLVPLRDGAPQPGPKQAPPQPQPSERRNDETFYGLEEPPFGPDSDVRFFYHSGAHDRATQSMLDAIRRRDAVVLLLGPAGIGKTMLTRVIVEQLDRRTLTSVVADPALTPEQLLRKVLVDFGVMSAADLEKGKLSHASRAELSAALRDFLYTLAPLQAFAVVIIDEAQNLSPELLDQVRVLADMGGKEKSLQVMLIGEPSITTRLARPELGGLFRRITVRATLDALVADEIDGYVRHRLTVAGASSRVEFDVRAIHRLYELSGGVPRLVNLLCERALKAGYEKSASIIEEDLIDAAAEALDLAPPLSKPTLAQTLALCAALLLLVLVGAAAGTFVFRSQMAAILDQWVQQPVLPGQPRPPLPEPFVARPDAGTRPDVGAELAPPPGP